MVTAIVAVLVFPRLSVAVAVMVYGPATAKATAKVDPVPVAGVPPGALHATVPVKPCAQVTLAVKFIGIFIVPEVRPEMLATGAGVARDVTMYGLIISLSSWSMMWQCQTYPCPPSGLKG